MWAPRKSKDESYLAGGEQRMTFRGYRNGTMVRRSKKEPCELEHSRRRAGSRRRGMRAQEVTAHTHRATTPLLARLQLCPFIRDRKGKRDNKTYGEEAST